MMLSSKVVSRLRRRHRLDLLLCCLYDPDYPFFSPPSLMPLHGDYSFHYDNL
jgi:hypothetical protein